MIYKFDNGLASVICDELFDWCCYTVAVSFISKFDLVHLKPEVVFTIYKYE